MRSPSEHVQALLARIQKMEAAKYMWSTKTHAHRILKLKQELQAWQILEAKDLNTSLQTFGEQTGLQDFADSQVSEAAKVTKQAKAFQTEVAKIAAKAAAANKRANANQTAAYSALKNAQLRAGEVVDPLWKSPIVIGSVVLLGLAVVVSRRS